MTQHDRAEHQRLASCFERWAEVCIAAGKPEHAEQCLADARLHARLAEARAA